MFVLVLNCGSSSIKFQLFEPAANYAVACSGVLERIGSSAGVVKFSQEGAETTKEEMDLPDHEKGVGIILERILDPQRGIVKQQSDIQAVGHRIVHGGENFTEACVIDLGVKHKIKELIPLAPLHNPAHLKGIEAVERLLPQVLQVAVFDTAFYTNLSPKAYRYPINKKVYQDYKVRKYGFHGTSHDYVSQKASEFVGADRKDLKIISCHLGNGASVTAIKDGVAFDTSMGFTPLDGVMMGTRSGSVDPGVIFYLHRAKGYSLDRINKLLNSESGIHGITQLSSDMRDVQREKAYNNPDAALALEMYSYRIRHYIGAYAANMGGLDMLIFTGGVGENQYLIRRDICDGLGYFGVELNQELNNKSREKATLLSTVASKIQVVLMPTNEELVICQETCALI